MKPLSKLRTRLIFLLFTCYFLAACGTVRLQVPEGHNIRLLNADESAEIHVERSVWFWLWGAKPISDNTTLSDIEKYHFTEMRAYTKQTMTDNILLLATSFFSLARRTLVVEGNVQAILKPATQPYKENQ